MRRNTILRVGNSLITARINLTGRRGLIRIVNDLSFSLLRFALRGFSDRRPCLLAMSLGLLFLQGCALLQGPSDIAAPSETPVQPAPSKPVPAQPTAKKTLAVPAQLPQTGEASWYGAQHQGKQTASGTIYDHAGLTAAHPNLPFGSKIKVTNLANGRSVEVEITDRGPFSGNRIIDLSQAAAKALEMIESGTATVRLESLSEQ
jgi:rare lipoprotein A